MIPPGLQTPSVSGGAKLVWVLLDQKGPMSAFVIDDELGLSSSQCASALSQLRALGYVEDRQSRCVAVRPQGAEA